MRSISLLVALALATTALPARAEIVSLGVTSDAMRSFDQLRGDISGIGSPSGFFSFNTDTNQLLSFNVNPGFQAQQDLSPLVVNLFNTAGPCDLQCFTSAINSTTFLTTSTRTSRLFTDFTFGTPLNGQVTVSQPVAVGFITVSGTLRVTGPVPEPATWAMMLLGFGAIGSAMRFQRRKLALA